MIVPTPTPNEKLAKQELKSLALYIHWAFCLSKCPYCDFNSHVTHTIPQELYATALIKELNCALSQIKNYQLTSIFFGGGTPSLMAPQTIEKLINVTTNWLPIDQNIEITLEANPTSVEIQKLQDFRQAGVNRISLGIQSLNEKALQALGRQHNVKQAIEALTLAKKLFPRISFDLIYAREAQTLPQWQKELQQALELTHNHLSLYQLTIEPGTLFAKYAQQGKLNLPNETLSIEMLLATEELIHHYGMENYEISNYAKPGEESRHNLAYWRYQDYIGIGPGAHGRMTEGNILYATECYKNPRKWLETVQKQGRALCVKEPLSTMDKAYEMLLMGLRLKEGVHATTFQKRCGIALMDALNIEKLNLLIKENFLIWDGYNLQTTQQGKIRLNTLLEAILK